MKILALDLGATMIKSAIVDEKGRISQANETPSEGKLGGPRLVENAINLARQYSGFECIGISAAGQVNLLDGSISYANENVPQFTGTPLKEIFSNKFSVYTEVLNDVHAAALGEVHYGAGKRYSDFICLTYGTGVGGAIVIDKKIYYGGFGVAGGFGHMVSHPYGSKCGCGQKGCYEQYASTTALVRAALEINPDCINGRIIFQMLESGDKKIRVVVDNWIEEVIIGLRTLIAVFNPSCIVMGGGVMRQDYILSYINERIYGYLNPDQKGVRILKAESGNHAGLLGASVYVLNKLKSSQNTQEMKS